MSIKVAMFSGGNGTASIAKALVAKGVDLTLLVNCYDDGLSTGELRKLFPGMLGPSDVRKNVARFSQLNGYADLLERRVDIGDELPSLGGKLAEYVEVVEAELIRKQQFLKACALGNLAFVGCWLTDGDRDFNRTVTLFSELCKSRVKILNVTQGENLYLMALRENDERVYTESEISTEQQPTPIEKLFFSNGYPKLNYEVREVLLRADVIVYGPGTQHSSLLPSYMTQGMAEVIAGAAAYKVYTANLSRDKDLAKSETVRDLTDKFLVAMSRGGQTKVQWEQLVDNTLVDGYAPLHLGTLRPGWKVGNWLGGNGVHDGAAVASYIVERYVPALLPLSTSR